MTSGVKTNDKFLIQCQLKLKYRIFSNRSRGFYLFFVFFSAVSIWGRLLFEYSLIFNLLSCKRAVPLDIIMFISVFVLFSIFCDIFRDLQIHLCYICVLKVIMSIKKWLVWFFQKNMFQTLHICWVVTMQNVITLTAASTKVSKTSSPR